MKLIHPKKSYRLDRLFILVNSFDHTFIKTFIRALFAPNS